MVVGEDYVITFQESDGDVFDDLRERLGITVYSLDAWYFDDVICEKTLKEHFHCGTLEGLGIGDYDCGMVAAVSLRPKVS